VCQRVGNSGAEVAIVTPEGSDYRRPKPTFSDPSPAPVQFAAPWGARGYLSPLDGPVHWVEFGPDGRGGPGVPPLVFVHGLGGSHLNWCQIGPRLAEGRRAVALDLHGFGLTPGSRRNATVEANARLVDRFSREVTGTPVILVGNSMGGLISVLQTASAPGTVAGLVLIDPALPVPRQKPDWPVTGRFLLFALPGLGELTVRALSHRLPEVAVRQQIELCFADPSRADPAMVQAANALARHRQDTPSRNESLLAAARSLLRVIGRSRRYQAMMAGIDVPVLLIGGDADRLVPVASMRLAAAHNPRWETAILAGVGHTPQLEVPEAVADAIQDWLGRHFS